MTREIRKETGLFGGEKEVIYEKGEKVGETRHETTLFGTPVDRTYDIKGNRVSETRHETTLFGTPVDRTYVDGERVSETRKEDTLFGGPVERTYDNERNLISETKKENTFFNGQVKRVYNEDSSSKRSCSSESYSGSSSGSGSNLWGFGLCSLVVIGLTAFLLDTCSERKTKTKLSSLVDVNYKESPIDNSNYSSSNRLQYPMESSQNYNYSSQLNRSVGKISSDDFDKGIYDSKTNSLIIIDRVPSRRK